MQKIGKEVKIGLAVIGVLVAAFGFILVRRLSRPDDLQAPVPSKTPAAIASTDKPAVVSATGGNQPTEPTPDSATSSRSLFSSKRRIPASDSADTSTEPRGSFFPTAGGSSFTTAANNPPNGPAQGSAAPNSAASASGGPADSSAAGISGTSAFSRPGADNGHSMFTGGGSAPPAEATSGPSAFSSPPANSARHHSKAAGSSDSSANPSNVASDPGAASPLGNSSDPFKQASSAAGPSADGASNVAVAAQQSSGAMPADASAPRTSGVDAGEQNPLRSASDGFSRATAASGSPPVQPQAELPQASAQASVPPSQAELPPVTPPPITSTAINVPSQFAPSANAGGAAQPPDAAPLSATAYPVGRASAAAASQPSNATSPTAAADSPHKPGQYIVQADDNYWTVSEKVYGSGGYFKAIYEHNRRTHAQSDRLRVGDVLDVPEAATLERLYPELCPKPGHESQAAVAAPAAPQAPIGTRLYSVVDGDTLYEIARRELGRASRWGEIYQLNHDQLGNDFSYLHPGAQLVIPADRSSADVAREPNTGVQR